MRNGATGQGSNSVHVRQYNERVILTAASPPGRGLEGRSRPACQPDQQHRRRRSSASWRSSAWSAREGKRTGARGQPATILRLDPERRLLDRRQARPPLDRRAAGRFRRPGAGAPPPGAGLPDAGGGRGVRRCDERRRRCAACSRARRTGRIAGLGVAMPYNLGSWQRELDIPLGRLPRWNEFDLARPPWRRRPASRCSARTTARRPPWPSCSRAGAATLDDFLYVFIGAALGGGVVLGGDYHRGAHGNAGDLGLMPAGPSRLGDGPAPERPRPTSC